MPLDIEQEVEEVAEKIFVVRLPVVVAELVVGAEVAEYVAMVEVAGKGKEVAVVAVEAEGGVGSWVENWTVVMRKVRGSSEDRRGKALEEEKDAVRKKMNVWCPAKVVVPSALLMPRGMRGQSRSDSGYGSIGSRGFTSIVGGEGAKTVGERIVLGTPLHAPKGPRAYGGVALGGEKRLSFKHLGSVPEGRKMYGLDLCRGLLVYRGTRDWQRLERNGHRGMEWYCWNQDGYQT
ncbi:hypothetical protein HOY80DRAFT_1101026 [Tuber brumale]|nr:hypothetical protein HOY80DRAFT_1101026 [Tuber brumale]